MLKKYLKLYKYFSLRSIQTLMEYKADFLIGLSGFLVTQTIGIIMISIIFNKIPVLNGWSYNQVLFIYAFAQIPRGFDHLVTDNLWIFSRRIISRSEFDKYLLKPINPLFHVIAEKFQPDAIGELLIGLMLIIISVLRLKINITILNLFVAVILIISGSIIYTSIKLFFASFAFWIRSSQNILSVFYSFSDFAKYPISIYSTVIKFILTFIVPFAFTAYYPAAYFLNKEKLFIGVGGTVISAVISFAIAYFVWCKGINAYESAGN